MTASAHTVATVPDRDLRERFLRLAKDWKDKSRYLSNTAQMAMLPP
jgi:hypothetical protein